MIFAQNKLVFLSVLLFLFYALISFSGYGNDNDTYRILSSGWLFLLDGVYSPSRAPGYFIPEVVIGLASLAGDHYLSNAISSLLAVLSIYIFTKLLAAHFETSDIFYISALVAFNPFFVIAATSSIDYMYSIFFMIFGVYCYKKSWTFAGAILLGVAIGSRLSNAMLVTIFYLFMFYRERANYPILTKYLISSSCAVLVTICCYIPSFIAFDYSLGFVTYYMAEFGLVDHVSRFVYKNIYLFGVIPFLIIMVVIMVSVYTRRARLPRTILAVGAIFAMVVQELLFLKVPLEISYLLPILFLFYPILFIAAEVNDRTKKLLLFFVLAYSFAFNIELLSIKYNQDGNVAIGATISPSIKPGVVVRDMMNREESARLYQLENLRSRVGLRMP